MSQVWDDNTYALTDVGTTNLQAIENNFAALKTSFSGAGAPASAAGQLFFDTTKKLLKVRDQANGAWLGIMAGDATYKMWVYVNAAGDGWVVDSGVTDTILAIKGGSDAYNVSGGAAGGTWTQPNHTHTGPSHTHGVTGIGSHNHKWYNSEGSSSDDKTWNSSGAAVVFDSQGHSSDVDYLKLENGQNNGPEDAWTSNATSSGTTDAGGTAATGNGATAATWRPSASIGTLQYMDI